MNDVEKLELMERFIAVERERMANEPSAPLPQLPLPPPIHYTELPTDGDPNWSAYLREVGRLLADGLEGRWVLIHNGCVAGVFDTESEAANAASTRFPSELVLLHQLRTWEPAIRTPTFLYRCRSGRVDRRCASDRRLTGGPSHDRRR